MNPKIEFDKIVEQTIKSEGEKIKNTYIDAEKNEISFLKVNNELNKLYYTKHENESKKPEALKKYYDVFLKALGDYKGDLQNKIKNSLEKAIKKHHESTDNKLESYDYALKSISKLYGLKRVNLILTKLDEFFEDMYELGDFSHFRFEDFDYQSSKEWDKVHKKRFPDPKKNLVSSSTKQKDFKQEIANTNRYLKNFDEQEKLLLLRLFYRLTRDYHTKRDEIQYSDFSKIILIISNLEKPDIFYKDSQSSSVYKKVNKEDYTNNEIKILELLVPKLRIYDMTFSVGIINQIIDKHNREKQKKKNKSYN